MKRKKWIYTALLMGTAVLLCTGCVEKKSRKTNKNGTGEQTGTQGKMRKQEDEVITGMYLPYGEDDDSYIFVDTNHNELFSAKIPDDNLTDENGKELDDDDLRAGDMVAMYGEEIVAERFPPLYPAITKMVRVKQGTQKDADQYQELLATFYQAPDEKELPYLDIENKQKTAIVTSVIQHGGYEWSYVDENGQTQTELADALHVLQWERSDAQLVELNCDTEDTDLKLFFSKKPQSVKVTRWDSTATMDDLEKGEAVHVELDGKEAEIEDAKTGSIYEVVAEWKNGSVIYGFAVK